jgi:cystathionine gamma-synthase
MPWRPETIAVAAGRDRAPGAPFSVPPTFASTYRDGGAIGYGRFGNPTWGAFEEALAALEGGHAVAFGSGMAAIAAALAQLPAGATVVLPAGAYLGTRGLLKELEAGGRLRLRPIDVTDTGAVLDSLPGAGMLWLESPTNPMLGIAELPRIIDAASRAGVATVVDNTFATPLNQQPLAWGATAVVHSATKYLGGHSDLMMGAVVTADPGRRDALVAHRTLHGAIPGVMEAYLALRGLRTLPVRLARQQDTAAQLAEWLAGHPRVTRVRYPGLAGDPHHERARAQMRGFGAIVSFEVADGPVADRLTAALRLVVNGTSLGGVETTIERRRRWAGEEHVPEGLLRLSVGLEHPDDLRADLDDALGHAEQPAEARPRAGPPAGVRFREAGPGDAAALLALKRGLDLQTSFMLLEPDERTEDEQDIAADLATVAAAGNSVVLVAEAGGRLVGYAEARGSRFRRKRATAHVVIGVLAAAGGRGVGTRLLRELDRWAPAHGIRRLELTVMAHNQRASALYRRVGYTVEGRARECLLVDGRPADELYMAKLFPEPAQGPSG